MKEYQVEIKEILSKTVTAETNSVKDARELVEKEWKDSEHVLGADDFTGVSFHIQKRSARESVI